MTNVKNREMSVAGSFYPDKQEELLAFIEHFNSLAEDTTLSSKAVIVPHAGYVYSGYTANLAYKVLKNSSIKNFSVSKLTISVLPNDSDRTFPKLR